MPPPPCLRPSGSGTDLNIRVQPRASRDRLGEPAGDALKIWVTAPPVDSAANDAVLRLVAERLGCRRAAVTLVKGRTSRQKVLHIEGLDPEAVLARLANP